VKDHPLREGGREGGGEGGRDGGRPGSGHASKGAKYTLYQKARSGRYRFFDVGWRYYITPYMRSDLRTISSVPPFLPAFHPSLPSHLPEHRCHPLTKQCTCLLHVYLRLRLLLVLLWQLLLLLLHVQGYLLETPPISVLESCGVQGKNGGLFHIHQGKLNTSISTPSECLGACWCYQHDVRAKTKTTDAFVSSLEAPFRFAGLLSSYT